MTVTVKGNPTPEELAAALVALMSHGASVPLEPEPAVSRWADRTQQLRHPLPHGAGAWRHAL